MPSEIDLVLMESLVLGGANALEEIAEELLQLRQGWVANGAIPSAVEWLDGLISEAGWWSGRLAAGSKVARPS